MLREWVSAGYCGLCGSCSCADGYFIDGPLSVGGNGIQLVPPACPCLCFRCEWVRLIVLSVHNNPSQEFVQNYACN